MELQQAISDLCQALKASYYRSFPDSAFPVDFEISSGRKYLKVILISCGQRSVHAFIDKVTGRVFKPASWNTPAKGARYNLLDEVSRQMCLNRADWSGGYLYARG